MPHVSGPKHHNVVKSRQAAIEILKAVKAADGEATIEMLQEKGYSRFQVKSLLMKEQIRISGKIDTGQRGRPKMKFTVASKGNKRLATAAK
jgi:predicted ArsR family transcriptional regulator